MFSIEKVIEELKKTDPHGFIIESHFQVQFGYALKKAYPSAEDIVFEWTKNKKRVDLKATIENRLIGFEFKYCTKEQSLELNNGLTVNLKNQVARDLVRIGFWRDIEKIEHFKKTNCFHEGYCLLLTNDDKVFTERSSDCLDFDFCISSGKRKPTKNVLQYHNLKGELKYSAHIKRKYDLEPISFNANMFLLIAKI